MPLRGARGHFFLGIDQESNGNYMQWSAGHRISSAPPMTPRCPTGGESFLCALRLGFVELPLDVGVDARNQYPAQATISEGFNLAAVQERIELVLAAITEHVARPLRAAQQGL